MSSESSAVLFNRLRELGLAEFEPQFRAKGWTSQGSVAFASTYSPAQTDDRLLREQFLNVLAPDDASKHPALRRLWFESYSVAMVEIKARTLGSTNSTPRKLTEPELVARRAQTQERVGSLKLEGELDVSDDLINMFVGMVENKRLTYVPLEKATKRELGIEGIRSDPFWAKDAKGALVEHEPDASKPADLSTDLRAELAFQRLGLATDMAGLMSFKCHEEMRLTLQQARLEDPPPGYARISLHQVLNAHKEFWVQMSLQAAGKLTPMDGLCPLDDFAPAVLVSRKFTLCLNNLPASVTGRQAQPSGGTGSGSTSQQANQRQTKAQKKRKALEARVAEQVEQARGEECVKAARTSTQPNSRSGSKGTKVRTAALPKQLIQLGCTSAVRDGEPICFAYNLDGCARAQPG